MSLDWTLGTLLPVLCLAAAGALVPIALYRRHGPSIRALAVDVAVSAVVLLLGGAALFALLYAGRGANLGMAPLAFAVHFLKLGLSAAIIWLPVLLLTGLALGQRTEARLSKLREAREAGR